MTFMAVVQVRCSTVCACVYFIIVYCKKYQWEGGGGYFVLHLDWSKKKDDIPVSSG